VSDVDSSEGFVTVRSEIDKKNKERYKPLKSELVADMLELIRHYDLSLLPEKYHL
jgi:hypothetical protein